jgi:hypothetical protein
MRIAGRPWCDLYALCAASLLALRPIRRRRRLKKVKILGGIHGFARGDHHFQRSLVVVRAHHGGTIALRAYFRDD